MSCIEDGSNEISYYSTQKEADATVITLCNVFIKPLGEKQPTYVLFCCLIYFSPMVKLLSDVKCIVILEEADYLDLDDLSQDLDGIILRFLVDFCTD